MNTRLTRRICISALMAALIYVFTAFLRRYNRVVGAVRTVLLLAAAISLLTGYALDLRKINLIAAGALALVMLISLPVLQNEKLLPKEEAKS